MYSLPKLACVFRGLPAVALLGLGSLRGQIGDVPEEGPQVPLPAVREMKVAPVLTPEEELRSFQLPPGFRAELVAAEPLIRDPVAAAFDLEGNLWVVEMNNYNTGLIKDLPALAAGATASAVESCKIIKLESSRHDGHYDRRVVWLEGLERARGILVVRDGLLIADSPNLWLARDVHSTGHCDEKTLLVPNYEAWSDPEESGSLMWGRDNVIHDIDYAYDYRYRASKVEPQAVPVRGQFGLSQDDLGRLFFNRNSDHLHADLFAPTYGVRNPHVMDLPWANVRIAEDQEVWPSHPTPAINRAYRKGVLGQQTGGLRDDGTLLEFTAACSPLIYRGANFPASFYGNAFVPEPAANLIKRDLLLESQGELRAVNAYRSREFLTSTDARFRPVALLNTPDGAMLVVDMYRGLLQEYHYVTTYLRDQTLGRHLDAPVAGRGRIFRIVSETGPRAPWRPGLAHARAAELAPLLSDPNGWWRDTAQQALVENVDHSADAALIELATKAPNAATRIPAWWVLDGLDAITPALLARGLDDPAPQVRATVIRLHERWLAARDGDALLPRLLALARDPQPEVVVQLALTLGASPGAAALPAMEEVLLAAGAHPFLPKAIASGLNGRDFAFFQQLVSHLGKIGPRPEIETMLTTLASSIIHGGDRVQSRRLIAAVSDDSRLPKWGRVAVLAGFEPLTRANFRRSIGATRVLRSAELAPLTASADPDLRDRATRLAASLAKEEEAARRRAAEARPLTPAEQVQYASGATLYQACAGCHQPAGTGQPNVAPSLVDSRWVAGYPEVLARIVLNGKEGTPGFPGAMPPVGGTFSDEQVAALLTYIRNSWDLHYGAVDAALVAKVRAQNEGRQAAWTDAELQRMENAARREHARRDLPPAPR